MSLSGLLSGLLSKFFASPAKAELADVPLAEGQNRLLVVLTSLCAEGTPVLVLDMCRCWMAQGISPFVVTLLTSPNELEEEFRAAGIPVSTLALPPSGHIRFLKLAVGIYEACRRVRPRAVLSMPLGWHAFTFMGARGAGVTSTAAHVGNYPPAHLPAALAKFRQLVQLGQPLTDTLICCSAYVQQGACTHFGVPLRKTTVIYNGVDVEAFASRSRRARNEHARGAAIVVGMVARLEVHKDQPTLIRAAALLRDSGHPVEVWLVGEGTRRAEYEALIAELGLAGSVRLLGMRRDIPELLAQMDAFVFSAKPDEGLGVALIEAMAASVPIIATDVGACREVLENGTLGELVPPADVEAMANAIRRLTSPDFDGRDRLAAAQRRATETFSIEEMAKRYARSLKLVP
ncbi:MAG TPA: glycosyltransferase [Polyangia bacterium]